MRQSQTTKTLKITLVKSTIGFNEKQVKVVESLGLRRIRHSVTLPDTPASARHGAEGAPPRDGRRELGRMGLRQAEARRGLQGQEAFRVGRGQGTGNGKTAGRGHKGAQSRSGFKFKRGFEGGQMPLHRRVPKRGFTNIFRIEYAVVNVDRIAEVFEAGTVVTPELLQRAGPGGAQRRRR